jgi:hypothetical protein
MPRGIVVAMLSGERTMKDISKHSDLRFADVTAAANRAHALVSDALEASEELDAPRPVVIAVKTVLRLAVVALDGLRDLLSG